MTYLDKNLSSRVEKLMMKYYPIHEGWHISLTYTDGPEYIKTVRIEKEKGLPNYFKSNHYNTNFTTRFVSSTWVENDDDGGSLVIINRKVISIPLTNFKNLKLIYQELNIEDDDELTKDV